MKNNRLIGILLMVVFISSVPLMTMRFTNEVNWTLSDFIVAGFLLLGTGLTIEAVARNVKDRKTKISLMAGTFLVLFLVWAELAVGVFGTPIAGS